MRIGDEHKEKEYIIVDADGNEITSKSIEAIKVCGITYSDNEELANEKNILGTPVFTHYTTARGWYAPHDTAIINNSKIESQKFKMQMTV